MFSIKTMFVIYEHPFADKILCILLVNGKCMQNQRNHTTKNVHVLAKYFTMGLTIDQTNQNVITWELYIIHSKIV